MSSVFTLAPESSPEDPPADDPREGGVSSDDGLGGVADPWD
jgi:hypothetical protein